MSSHDDWDELDDDQKKTRYRSKTRDMKEKIIENILEADPKLNAQFDRMVVNNLVQEEKGSRLQNRKRRHGRPDGGKITFDMARIEALPLIGNSAKIARTLGVKLASVQQWCALKENPLPSITKEGHKLLRKDILVAWLIKTGRYKARKES